MEQTGTPVRWIDDDLEVEIAPLVRVGFGKGRGGFQLDSRLVVKYN